MSYNIVTKYSINQIFKSKSKYFKVNLGYSSTKEISNGDRQLNEQDDFAFFYNNLYKTTIQAQGSIGNISFYSDHYILEDKIAFYYNKEEFIFDFDEKLVTEKGIDFYLGHLIKTINEEYKQRVDKEEKVKEEQKNTTGVSNKILENPGNVTYADLKAYLDKKSSERLIF